MQAHAGTGPTARASLETERVEHPGRSQTGAGRPAVSGAAAVGAGAHFWLVALSHLRRESAQLPADVVLIAGAVSWALKPGPALRLGRGTARHHGRTVGIDLASADAWESR